jgi:hypothetical protein
MFRALFAHPIQRFVLLTVLMIGAVSGQISARSTGASLPNQETSLGVTGLGNLRFPASGWTLVEASIPTDGYVIRAEWRTPFGRDHGEGKLDITCWRSESSVESLTDTVDILDQSGILVAGQRTTIRHFQASFEGYFENDYWVDAFPAGDYYCALEGRNVEDFEGFLRGVYVDTSADLATLELSAATHLTSTPSTVILRAGEVWVTENGYQGVIFPADMTQDQSVGRIIGETVDGYWTPSTDDVESFERGGLKDYLKDHSREFYDLQDDWSRLASYNRQYFGLIIAGQRIIYANFLCETDFADQWTTQIVVVMDGGDCFFNIQYNVDTDTYSDLYVNGYA